MHYTITRSTKLFESEWNSLLPRLRKDVINTILRIAESPIDEANIFNQTVAVKMNWNSDHPYVIMLKVNHETKEITPCRVMRKTVFMLELGKHNINSSDFPELAG